MNTIKTFAINTLGCKVNQYDSQQIRELLCRFGLTESDNISSADLLVVNTCCVTQSASAKSRQAIRKFQKQNNNATIIVAGCLPVLSGNELANLSGNIRLIGNRSDLSPTIAQITGQCCEKKCPSKTNKTVGEAIKPQIAKQIKHKNKLSAEDAFSQLPPITAFSGHSRAFLKIQDGCDAHCTYCIIPQVRKNVCNKNVKTVISEAKALIASGHKEIVLTVVFLGAYGQNTTKRKKWDTGKNDWLAALLDDLAGLDGLERLRLSSLEPADVTEKLLDTFCKHDNIAPHLHLPLQSGSEKILKKMCRQYTAADFRATVAKIKARLDRPAITADIIVGFPGESDEDFADTVQMAKDCGFAKMHIFPFSPRENTPAAKMTGKVKSEIIKERSKLLHNLDKKLAKKFRLQFAGERVSIIVEDTNPPQGRCSRYFMVKLPHHKNIQKGDLVCAKLDANCQTAKLIK